MLRNNEAAFTPNTPDEAKVIASCMGLRAYHDQLMNSGSPEDGIAAQSGAFYGYLSQYAELEALRRASILIVGNRARLAYDAEFVRTGGNTAAAKIASDRAYIEVRGSGTHQNAYYAELDRIRRELYG